MLIKTAFCSIYNTEPLVEAAYPYKLHQCVVDVGTLWEEEAATRAEIVEEKQILFLEAEKQQQHVCSTVYIQDTKTDFTHEKETNKSSDKSHKET